MIENKFDCGCKIISNGPDNDIHFDYVPCESHSFGRRFENKVLIPELIKLRAQVARLEALNTLGEIKEKNLQMEE